jgi:hypothetical protein
MISDSWLGCLEGSLSESALCTLDTWAELPHREAHEAQDEVLI